MRKIVYLICFVYSIGALEAQKMLSVSEAVLKQRSSLAPEKLNQLTWVGSTDNYSYIGNNANGVPVLYSADAKTNQQAELLSLTNFNTLIKEKGFKEMKAFPSLKWLNTSLFTCEIDGKELSVNLTNKSIEINNLPVLLENAENDDNASNGNIAFTVDNNVFVNVGGTNIQISKDGSADIVYGKSVHREEFGISKGTFWSPDGKQLAFYRMDQTNVTNYPIMEIGNRPATARMIKYPMAGDSSHYVTVGIYNTETKSTVYLKTGTPRDQYLTNIAWSPDAKHVYIALLNRDQNHLKFNSYNAQTGDFEKTLFEEKDEKYVQPMNPMEFVPGKPNEFVWRSERDGYNHIYLYDTNGKMLKQLTKGNWVVTATNGFDEKGENLIFTATIESPVTRHLCKVNLKTGKVEQLTKGTGTHTPWVSKSGMFVLDHLQSLDVPREYSVYSVKENKKTYVIKTSEDPLKDYALGKLSIFTINAPDGTPLYARQFLPVNFDSTKKYPTLVYLYGGPNAQMVNNTWNGGGDLWFQYMAENGYVVFTVDSRGSENRGKAFEQATFRNLGVAETNDQLVGINYLRKKNWVDTTNMIIYGWSFGGFMTTNMMVKHPDLFKVAIAGGPVINWKYYEVMYTERYMDTPQTNPDGYKNSDLTAYAKNLKGRLLMIHGTEDPVVVWQHSLMFVKACVDNNKLLDYYVYPGHEHNVLGKDRANLYEKITDYIFLHTKQ